MPRSRSLAGFWWPLFLCVGFIHNAGQESNGQTTREDSRMALSPEGKRRQAAHAFLFREFAEGKELRFLGEGRNRVLDEIVIANPGLRVTDELQLELPAGSERVASMFRYLVLRGKGLENLQGLEMLPYAANSSMAVSTKQSDIYRVKVSAMPIPSVTMPRIQIKSRCKPGTEAVIEQVALNSQGKLSAEFDDIPYRNLGVEYPRSTVRVHLDLDHELSIEGHVDLEREKFCRYYAAPGNLHPSFERWAFERNFLPGRQIFKFQPALVVGYSKNQPQLTENSEKPGAADLRFFDQYDSSGSIAHTIPEFRDIKFAMCFNDYPDFMSVKEVGRGTPLIDHFDDAAELAAAYVEDQIRDGGRTASYWEVKNEATIKSEWDYHWNPEHDAWALLADFHNRVADAIHERSPQTKVGGPSSAWMQLQAADFGLYRNQARLMDLTKDHVDFYSHHFYEDIGTLGAWERREGKYTNYLLGRMEAILDMLRAHMHETNNVKPMLITECGSLQPGRGPSDYWLRIRSYSAYMHKLMQRPEQIDLAVPFAFLSIPWNPQSGDAAFIPREGKPSHAKLSDCDPTPLRYLFELWRDFDGRRIPVDVEHPWLDVTAVHNGNRVQIALTNMGGRRLSVDLSDSTGDSQLKSVTQRRLRYVDGEVRYEDSVEHNRADSIPIDVEETTIVTLEMERPLVIQGVKTRRTHHAAGTAVKAVQAASTTFVMNVSNPSAIEAAALVIGIQRDGGLPQPLAGTFNGVPFSTEAAWLSDIQNLFAPVAISVPVDAIESTNQIVIEPVAEMTITSVHLTTMDKASSRAK